MKKEYIFLGLIVTAAFLLRFFYCCQMPLSGDECITLIQSSGKAYVYNKSITDRPVPIEQWGRLMQYSDDYTIADVLRSMKEAGMHPPLYYCLFHYLLKFAGNDILAVRLPSILFSTASILLLYILFRTLIPDISALPAALLLAISAYGIHYAHMVRPYPFLMFLSLLSVWLMLKMCGSQAVSFKRPVFWGYIFTAIAGFYTIYHFVFVFIFQMIFLFLSSLKSKQQLLTVMAIPVIILLFYLLWIPGFLYQSNAATAGPFYFHGAVNPLKVYRYFLEFDFTSALPGTYGWYKFAIVIAITAAILGGGVRSLKTAYGRCFAAAMTGYLAFNIAADLKMHTLTLNVTKLLFFIIPLLFLYLAAGISLLIKSNRFWGLAGLGIACAVLLFNSLVLLENPTAEDDPAYLSSYRSILADARDSNASSLVIINEIERRYVLPLAHAFNMSGLDLLTAPDMTRGLQHLDMSKYALVCFICPRYDKTFSADMLNEIRSVMEQKNYIYNDSSPIPEMLRNRRILLFKKK